MFFLHILQKRVNQYFKELIYLCRYRTVVFGFGELNAQRFKSKLRILSL